MSARAGSRLCGYALLMDFESRCAWAFLDRIRVRAPSFAISWVRFVRVPPAARREDNSAGFFFCREKRGSRVSQFCAIDQWFLMASLMHCEGVICWSYGCFVSAEMNERCGRKGKY